MENLVKQLQSFYNNKKVFITGHTGFKGSWLMALLTYCGATVKGYALEPEYEEGLYNILKSSSPAASVIADIRDKKKLKSEIIVFNPDYIFHLAAQPLVRRSYEIPAETFDINVTGTANLLEAIKGLSKKCTVLVITTDKVYENKERDLLYKEDDILGGYDPYSASKACAEITVGAFRNSFFHVEQYHLHQKALASARAGNVIGGGDWSKDRILPDIIRALKEKDTVKVRNPEAVRPWQHVLEPLIGYLVLAGFLDQQSKSLLPAYNFGPHPQDHLMVKELVKTAIEVWGEGSWQDVSKTGDLHEAALLKLDIQNAQKDLGWVPKLSAKQAIEWTVEWYKKPVSQLADFTFEQIKNYLAK